jgi:lipoprotein-anchoring transpeptidase ErfK/SrfK
MNLLSRGLLAASLMLGFTLSAQTNQQPQQPEKQCHWWQFHCDDTQSIEGLPADAPRHGTVITVDTATNQLYLFKDGRMVDKSLAATGSEKLLKHGSRVWMFRTPQGHLKVLRKIEDPVWTKPDWAFIEAGERVPPPNSPKRQVKGHLGKYALDLGDGIMIHGTDEFDSIGRKASHGCIRLPDDMLETVYNAAPIGTDVYIFESRVPQTATKTERHSDLE